MPTISRSVCPKDCPDTCGMLTHVESGRVVKVVGDPDHPVTRGFLCGRFQHYEELVHHPDRLLRPLVRDDKRAAFRETSWDEAIGLVAARLAAIAARHGGGAILPYSYLAHLGVLANHFPVRLWNRLGTSRVGMEICAMAGAEAMARLMGRIRGTEPQFLDRTRLYVAWGRNPRATGVHAFALTKDIRPRIVVDPLVSETAEGADIHVRPRPGTDALLAAGLIRLILEAGQADEAFLAARTSGWPAMRDAVLSIPLERVLAETGVPERQLREVAHLYATTKPGLIHLGVGLQRNANGGEMIATIAALAAVTGQVGTRGGGVLYANFDWRWNDITRPELRADVPTFSNMVQLGRTLTDDDRIKALFVYNSNPAATTPRQDLVRRGLARDDLFVVVHDMFLTDTAQHANVVLPACSYAEAWDLLRSYWHDHAQVNVPAIAPLGESRSNAQLVRDLATRLGFEDECFRQSDEDAIREAMVGTGLDFDALCAGPVPVEDPEHTSFEEGTFPTPSGRMELIVPALATPVAPPGFPYRFLTPKSPHLHGSQVFNVARKRAALETAWLDVHPDDAAREGLVDGGGVRVWNERGAVELVVRIGDRVLPGVVASRMVRWGANANATTSDELADMGGNSTFHTNYVALQPLATRLTDASRAPV